MPRWLPAATGLLLMTGLLSTRTVLAGDSDVAALKAQVASLEKLVAELRERVAKLEKQASRQSPAVSHGASNPAIIESYIESNFDGLSYGNIYKLANGQIWEQTDAWVWVWVWVNPRVTIWSAAGGYKMKVEGIEHAVMVRQIK